MPNLLKLVGFTLIIWIVPFYTLAYCTVPFGETSGYISFGNVIVQRDTPVGSVIATSNTGGYRNGVSLASCTEQWSLNFIMSKWGTLSTLGNKIYNTNIPGVGIRIGFDYNSTISPFPYITKPFLANQGVYLPAPGITAELIKTGTIISGNLDNGVLIRGDIVDDGSSVLNVTLNGNNNITSISCDVISNDISVSLGNHKKIEFSGPGTTTKWTYFSVSLQCDTGTNISMTVNATPENLGDSGIIKLDSGEDVAQGIGIQLFIQNIDGTDSPVNLNNLINYGKSLVNGVKTINFQARYYQTSQTVTPGVANATVTFTMTYQ
ncbi:fimbrial protein [Salmonella enterica subsp. enterica]|nr:fimbrial protein [Salmonella enterica subsp. enterica]